MLNKISLRIRLTLLTAAVLLIISSMLTYLSVFNATNNIVMPLERSFDTTITSGALEATVTSVPSNVMVADRVSYAEEALVSIKKSKSAFTSTSMIYMVILVFTGTIMAWFIAGIALKPVKELSEIIESIDEKSLSINLKVPESKDEIYKLTKSFNKMLIKLNKAFESQKRFTQNAAHELKTPLASILTTIDVLELDDENNLEEYKETIEVTKINIERMSKIVSELLAINNKANIELNENIDGKKVIETIIKDYERFIEEKNIAIEVTGTGSYMGNKSLIEGCFKNIIENAIRYNKKNSYLKINLGNDFIEFNDGGIGIPKDSLDKIFEPFYSVDPSRSKKLGGSGLGLSLVKSIVDKHNWKIEINSEIDKGTNIRIKM